MQISKFSRYVLLGTLLQGALLSAVVHAEPLVIDGDQQFGYAEFHFNHQDYNEAISEYKRFLYFFPADRRKAMAMYRMGQCYSFSGQYKNAINELQTLIDTLGDNELVAEAYFVMSDCYVAIHEFGPAVNNLHNLIRYTNDRDVKDRAYFRIGWIYLAEIRFSNLSLASATQGKARSAFLKIVNQDRYHVSEILDSLDKGKGQGDKSPLLAGLFSVVPGLGYIYCARYSDALIALLMTGGMGYASYEAYDHDQYALSAILGAVGLGFYSGSIYGSITSAHKINRYYDHRWLRKMKERWYLTLAPELPARRFQLALNVDF